MSTILLDGKKLSDRLFSNLSEIKAKFREDHKLIVITVGEDSASKVYVRNKLKACEKLNIKHEHIIIDENISSEDFMNMLVDLMNNNPKNTGIILQLPAPKHLADIFDKTIEGTFGVDGFDFTNRTLLYTNGQPFYYPATPKGIMLLLNNYNISLEGKHVVILGRSEIVGKPLAKMMLDENATVTVCHSKTQNLTDITKTADILIAAVGKPRFINETHVKEGVVIIDVGINRTSEGLCGDVDFDKVKSMCSAITPVPGGVGPMTVYALMENVLCTSIYNNGSLEE